MGIDFSYEIRRGNYFPIKDELVRMGPNATRLANTLIDIYKTAEEARNYRTQEFLERSSKRLVKQISNYNFNYREALSISCKLIKLTFPKECADIKRCVNENDSVIFKAFFDFYEINEKNGFVANLCTRKFGLLLYYTLTQMSEKNTPEFFLDVERLLSDACGQKFSLFEAVIKHYSYCFDLLVKKCPKSILSEELPRLLYIAASGQPRVGGILKILDLYRREGFEITRLMYQEALHAAIVDRKPNDSIDVLAYLVKNTPLDALLDTHQDGCTILHVAKGLALKCILEELKNERGCSFRQIATKKTVLKDSILHHANKSPQDTKIIIEQCKPFIAELLNPNSCNRSPLFGATIYAAVIMAHGLKEHLPQLLECDMHGENPLHGYVHPLDSNDSYYLKCFLEEIEPYFHLVVGQFNNGLIGEKNPMQLADKKAVEVLWSFCERMLHKEERLYTPKAQAIFKALLSRMNDSYDIVFFNSLFQSPAFVELAKKTVHDMLTGSCVNAVLLGEDKFFSSKFDLLDFDKMCWELKVILLPFLNEMERERIVREYLMPYSSFILKQTYEKENEMTIKQLWKETPKVYKEMRMKLPPHVHAVIEELEKVLIPVF